MSFEMSLETLLAVGVLFGGVFGWTLKLYGTQREHDGRLSALEHERTALREDHDTVVRLDTMLENLSRSVEELRIDTKAVLMAVVAPKST